MAFLDPDQKHIFQNMSPEEKLKVSLQLYNSAFETKMAALKDRNPELPEEDIRRRVREIFLYART